MANTYGISIDTLSPTFAPLIDDTAILRQWVMLQFQTRLGFFWSAPEIGCDLQALVLRGLTPAQLSRVPVDIESALSQDERIASVDVAYTTTFSALGSAQLNITVRIAPKDTAAAQPFSLSVVASAAAANQVTQGLGV